MKKASWILVLLTLALYGYGQENVISVSGGYSFTNVENTDLSPTGWRINGTYEFNPMGGPWTFGIAIGYIGLTATGNVVGTGTVDYNIGTVPIYFAPKYMFGSDKIKGYIKGALGTQTTRFKRTGVIEITDSDWGFYGGGSAGINYHINKMIFLNAEYELAWLSNSYYKDGLVNSVMLGIGIKF